MNKGALFLLGLGMLQMTGNVLRVPPIAAIGAATGASPAPGAFCEAAGGETYRARVILEWRDSDGTVRAAQIGPEVFSRLQGPYNRRSAYWAALAGGAAASVDPVIERLFGSALRYALSGEAPMLLELGIDTRKVEGPVRVRYEPMPGGRSAGSVRLLEIE